MAVDLSDSELWQGVIQYGKNMSTYKMAVGWLLIKYAMNNQDKVYLDDLAGDFFHLYKDRISNGQRQIKQVGRHTFVEQEVWALDSGNISESEAIENVKRKSLMGMVLPRFNTIHGKNIPVPFYTFDQRVLSLNKNALNLFADVGNVFLRDHVVARWGMLEHAFTERGFAESLTLDDKLEHFMHRTKRTNIARFTDVLSSYQNNRCFYCEREIYQESDVDHVIPRKIIQHDEVWNLVLSHAMCNREKSDKIPSTRFIEKLIKRNEDVMNSEHPLKERMRLDVGKNYVERRGQVVDAVQKAKKWNLGTYDGVDGMTVNDEFLFDRILRWREQAV